MVRGAAIRHRRFEREEGRRDRQERARAGNLARLLVRIADSVELGFELVVWTKAPAGRRANCPFSAPVGSVGYVSKRFWEADHEDSDDGVGARAVGAEVA